MIKAVAATIISAAASGLVFLISAASFNQIFANTIIAKVTINVNENLLLKCRFDKIDGNTQYYITKYTL